jgi:hypothetical protein
MATSVTQSLFGMTPEALQSQRAAALDQQALQFAQMTPMQQAQMGLFRGASQLGTGLAGLMGYQDPEMQRIKARQGLLGGIDMSDPAALRQAAQGTDPEMAQQLIGRAMEIEKSQADIAAANALTQQRQREANPVMELAKTGKYTPQSLALYSQSKNVSDLEFKDSEKGVNFSTNAEEVARELYGTNFGQLSPAQAAAVNTTVQARKESTAAKGAANVTQTIAEGGPWKPSEINPTLTSIRQELGPIESGISDATQGLTMLEMNNPKASAQVDRALATLSGDKQLSIQEVQMVANAGSFGQRVADSINVFFDGQAGTLSQEQKRELLEVLTATKTASYNRRRSELMDAYSLTDAPKETIEKLIGPEKKLPDSTMKRLVERSGVAYEPSKYTYRIGPQGQVQRKAKGK